MSPDLFRPILWNEAGPYTHIFLSDPKYCLPMEYLSPEALLHNREKPLIWHWTLLLHQLKYLDVF